MEVTAKAPGKVILAGEHAVVHGSTAVAASIDLYTYVTISDSDGNDELKLHLKDMGLEFSWPVGKIREALPGMGDCDPSLPKPCSAETITLFAALVEEENIPEAKITIAAGVSAFLWLYTSTQGYKPAKAVVTSELPLGSGLGSSAAFCVSLSAALLALSNSVNQDFGHQGWLTLKENELEIVNKWALEGEKIIHGKSSGIDNTVSTYVNLMQKTSEFGYASDQVSVTGNMIKFRSGELTCLESNVSLKMLITNTKVGRNTKALVAGVSERKDRHPIAMSAVFKAVDSISNEVASIMQSPAHDDIAITEKEDKLEELIEMNQGLLQCMGVSHASIETILRTTFKYKLASKLTGAGGGGCVLTLLPTLLSRTIVDKVITELESSGFQCFIAGIGGKGVQICFNPTS
ncbi:mevalonate kinase-like isoform X1 [Diospyros lotus]|uniref:mevalonate kinase-like isoform X1 n=1 Tax=Diospyros lotus TaxID=55363 RepID=UPI00225B439E|nr:mevalonate kinase-like isoform X1 [Diospyros lotus]XP_052183978.1 mevalonate kinase-like isoform X1 [Diospyros lotus]